MQSHKMVDIKPFVRFQVPLRHYQINAFTDNKRNTFLLFLSENMPKHAYHDMVLQTKMFS